VAVEDGGGDNALLGTVALEEGGRLVEELVPGGECLTGLLLVTGENVDAVEKDESQPRRQKAGKQGREKRRGRKEKEEGKGRKERKTHRKAPFILRSC
jgi:hypothetical protein